MQLFKASSQPHHFDLVDCCTSSNHTEVIKVSVLPLGYKKEVNWNILSSEYDIRIVNQG